MAAPAYTRTAVVLHWVLAILFATMITIGLYMTDLPRNTPERSWFFNLHKSLGLLTAGVILLRVGWRLRFGAPALAIAMPRWQLVAAKASHAALYACMLLMPLSGYLGSAFNKYGVKFFGLALPRWAWEDRRLHEIFVATHSWTADVFISLIAIHVTAALYHLIQRDGVFTRMILHSARSANADRRAPNRA